MSKNGVLSSDSDHNSNSNVDTGDKISTIKDQACKFSIMSQTAYSETFQVIGLQQRGTNVSLLLFVRCVI